MAGLEMTEDEFLAQSRRRGRKISSVLLTLSVACYFMARMLVEPRLTQAIDFAWASVALAILALLMLIVVMPLHNFIRRRRRMSASDK